LREVFSTLYEFWEGDCRGGVETWKICGEEVGDGAFFESFQIMRSMMVVSRELRSKLDFWFLEGIRGIKRIVTIMKEVVVHSNATNKFRITLGVDM
jgi:hypothetical protein